MLRGRKGAGVVDAPVAMELQPAMLGGVVAGTAFDVVHISAPEVGGLSSETGALS